MLTRENVILAINQLPKNFSVEQAIDELILLEKIERGVAQSEANDVIPKYILENQLPERLK
jgi:hypothetical protein